MISEPWNGDKKFPSLKWKITDSYLILFLGLIANTTLCQNVNATILIRMVEMFQYRGYLPLLNSLYDECVK